jgi:hypothetical protein
MDLLQSYASSEEDEEEEKVAAPPKLPMPSSILGMFPQEQHRDDPSLHQGRVN